MAEHPALPAVRAVALLASSEDLVRAVGHRDAAALLERADVAATALVAPGAAVAEPVCDLARQCIGLAAAVEVDFQDGALPDSGGTPDGEDWSWEFGVAVAEAIAQGLAAAALALVPADGATPQQASAGMELLEELGRELDCLAGYLFGGLCRLELHGWDTEQQGRLHCALRGICAWALEAVARQVGHERLSAGILWEFASCDPVWALALAKGVLVSVSVRGPMEALPFPADMERLQRSVLQAVLGLASPNVAFLAEVDGEVDGDEDSGIAVRNGWLVRHRSSLARSFVDCHAAGALLYSATRLGAAPGLASFLVSLLQPELVEDPDWSHSAALAAEVAEGRASSDALRASLRPHASSLWRLLASAAAAPPPGLLKDSAVLAHYVPPEDASAADYLLGRLSGGGAAEPAAVASLCILAANSGLAPEGSVLARVLADLPLEGQAVVAAQWARWKGPVKVAVLGRWQQLLRPEALSAVLPSEASPVPPHQPSADPAAEEPAPAPPPPWHSRRVVPPLREMMRDTPVEFRCALDGQLMLDPVQSPYGHVFERAGLAHALGTTSAGVCPVTGEALSLDQCVRLPEMRRRIVAWVRQQRSPNKR